MIGFFKKKKVDPLASLDVVCVGEVKNPYEHMQNFNQQKMIELISIYCPNYSPPK